jgi:UDP-N-acetylglucosamine diphosphorylase/glucosamine-1-phosphate N-acetyltransferase
MNYILFDDRHRSDLLPLVFTRPVCEIRIGIMTIREKWEKYLGKRVSFLTRDYLSDKYPAFVEDDNLLINGGVLPDARLLKAISKLRKDETLMKDGYVVAKRLSGSSFNSRDVDDDPAGTEVREDVNRVRYTWDVFSKNGQAIRDDYELLTKDKTSSELSATNMVIGDPGQVFIGEGAKVEFAYLNTSDGPIYIGKNAQVMEGAKIRGPFALGEKAVVKMDAKIYSDTTVGPYSKVGGEVQNTVIFGYSNKGHDGYLGNAVIGEWCNLGADTNNSNLKNTYDVVKLWSYTQQHFVSTGLQFCGLIMGDHSKSGINTMFNTGTVVGVSCNLYGAGFQRNFIPSFSWGSPAGLKEYNFKKACDVARAVMLRRGIEFDETEENILKKVLELSIGERR